MEMYIKVWKNQSATLLTTNGYALSTHHSEAEAHQVRQAWYAANGLDSNPEPLNKEDLTTVSLYYI